MKKIKSYCTQSAGDCNNCLLVNYYRDCKNISLYKSVEEAEHEVKEIEAFGVECK